MTTTCEQLDALLLDGDSASMQRAAAHAAECASCAETLAAWNDIGDTARSLHATWESDLLWPRIERELAHERSRRRPPVWSIAAAVALAAILGGGGWYGLRVHSERVAFDRTILREQAVAEVESAERMHLAAIERLEKVATPKLAEADSPLMVSYKSKLMLLDDAINECQTNIQQNRQNAHLRKQLLAVYSEKQRTLEDVLREETSNVSKQ